MLTRNSNVECASALSWPSKCEPRGRRIGVSVAKCGDEVLAAARDLVDFARHRGRLLKGQLKLGVIPTIGRYVLPKLLPLLHIRHRGADWLVRTDAGTSITSLFRRAHIALPPRARQARPPPPQPKARKRRGRPRRSATST